MEDIARRLVDERRHGGQQSGDVTNGAADCTKALIRVFETPFLRQRHCHIY
jgi:hypothetical protein